MYSILVNYMYNNKIQSSFLTRIVLIIRYTILNKNNMCLLQNELLIF